MILKNKHLLLFDLDGTLVDSAADLALAGNLMLQSLGRETFDESHFRQWIGNGATVMVKRALSGSAEINPSLAPALVDDALKRFFDFYRVNLNVNTQLYPGVLSTLETLKDRGYRLAIVTNKPAEFVDPINKALGIAKFFELTVGGDSLPWKKPDPRPLLHVAERLGTAIEHCVMIGDSKNDIEAANAAAMDSIGVTFGYNYGEDIGIYRPSCTADTFAQILALL